MCKVLILTVTIEIVLLAMAGTMLAAMMLLTGSGAAIGPEQTKKVGQSEAPRIVFNNTREQHCKPYGDNIVLFSGTAVPTRSGPRRPVLCMDWWKNATQAMYLPGCMLS